MPPPPNATMTEEVRQWSTTLAAIALPVVTIGAIVKQGKPTPKSIGLSLMLGIGISAVTWAAVGALRSEGVFYTLRHG